MPNHVFRKNDLIRRLEAYLGKTLELIDNKGLFEQARKQNRQKGIAGSVVEQCIFDYPPDSAQEADLLIVDGDTLLKTELKTTGLLIENQPQKHFVAKEPMSITGVGIFDIVNQEFFTSHFWEKLEHVLIIYYHYVSNHVVSPYEYKDFPLVGYEFHEFNADDIQILKRDWEYVKSLCVTIISKYPGKKDAAWKAAVKEEYIKTHGQLRKVLTYIDLAPKYPPRFRLKKPMVSSMVAEHFGYNLEQLPGRYLEISDLDEKCHTLTERYRGKTISQLATQFGIPPQEINNKGITEQITISMFGGTSKKLNQIELFERFGLIAKSIVITEKGFRTEDMKLFHIDFKEIVQTEYYDEGISRPFLFEDSEMYSYFADHEFLCIIFEEPTDNIRNLSDDSSQRVSHPLGDNKFVGFKRLVFSEDFIESIVRRLWNDTRDKIINNKLVDYVRLKADGTPAMNKSGSISSAPNFMKSKENAVFIRGSGADSSLKYKSECVNGIRMLPQYVWIKGTTVVKELGKLTE